MASRIWTWYFSRGEFHYYINRLLSTLSNKFLGIGKSGNGPSRHNISNGQSTTKPIHAQGATIPSPCPSSHPTEILNPLFSRLLFKPVPITCRSQFADHLKLQLLLLDMQPHNKYSSIIEYCKKVVKSGEVNLVVPPEPPLPHPQSFERPSENKSDLFCPERTITKSIFIEDCTTEQVTVFTAGGAEISKYFQFDFPEGKHHVIVRNVPQSQGGAAYPKVVICSKIKNAAIREVITVPVSNEEGNKEINHELKLVQDQQNILHKQAQRIMQRRSWLESYAQETSQRGDLSVENATSFLQFYDYHMHDLDLEQTMVERQIIKLQEEEESLLLELKNMQENKHVDLHIRVDVYSEGKVCFQIDYFEEKSMWYPVYEVSWSSSTKRMILNFFANVINDTSANWVNTKILLYDGSPAHSSVCLDNRIAIARPQRKLIDLLIKTKCKPTHLLKYKVLGVHTVNAGNSGTKIPICTVETEAHLEYKLLPMRSKEAYMVLVGINDSNYDLLEGTVNLTIDSLRTYSTALHYTPSNSPMSFFTGIDCEVTTHVGQKVVTVEDRNEMQSVILERSISVYNQKEREVDTVVVDELPISDDHVKVYGVKLSEYSVNQEGNVVHMMEVPAGHHITFSYKYCIDYPSTTPSLHFSINVE